MRDLLNAARPVSPHPRRAPRRGAIALASMLLASTALTGFAGDAAAPPASAWPADSVHQADVALETSRGDKTTLAATGGHVRLVSMFYASCAAVCPLTIDTLRRIDGELTAEERSRLAILLVTFDPEHDDPATLREFAGQHRIDDAHWTLGRASLADTRKLAGALDIRYRELDDGNFNHSTVLVLLDRAGRVLARTERMGTPDPAFVAAVRKALAGA